MIEVLKAYLQVASGVGDLTRQRALEAARQALAATPAAAVLPVASAGVDGLAAQASALADELLAAGRQNREMLGQLVRAEVDTVVARLGLDGRSDLEAELATSRARVRELERNLAAKQTGAARTTATKASARKTTAKKSTGTTKATAKKATARTTAKKATAATKTSSPAKATTRKATTRKATTRKAATRKAATKR
ncbi:MAG: hypothetical protein ABIV05_01600, partial [Actinomycetota bacterium]